MSMAWVMMSAALAAGAWGFSDFLAGLLSRRLPILTILIGSKVAAMLLALVVAAVRGVPPPGDPRLWLAVAGGLIGLPAMGLLYRAMRDGSLAVVAPVAAVAALVPVGWGLISGERIGLGTGLGIGVTLVGVTLASWPVHAARRRIQRQASLCALGAALGFGAYFVLLHEASAADQLWATVSARVSGGVGALILAVLLRRRVVPSPAGKWRAGKWQAGKLPAGKWPGLGLAAAVLLVGGFDAVADAAFIVAAAGALGPAAVMASLYPAVTVLLNRSLLRERLHAVHLCGVLAALFAVACFAR